MPYTYEYPRPTVTVDALLLRAVDQHLQILLIERRREPFVGHWAFPGGFMEIDEPAATAVLRELSEETGITPAALGDGVSLMPLMTASRPGRDPRARCVTLVFSALLRGDQLHPAGADDAAAAAWFDLDRIPPMAFDHSEILDYARGHLQWQAETAVVGRHCLADGFKAPELEALHRMVLDPKVTRESALDRGLRLRLLERVSGTTDQWRFIRPAPAFLVW
jgi:8-oxo-dGTP diphosphatase